MIVFIAWAIILIQSVATYVYVSHVGYDKILSRYSIALVEDVQAEGGNVCKEGIISGRLSKGEMSQLAEDICRQLGGVEVMTSASEGDENYLVSYGYTLGIQAKKNVNGKNINLNIAMSYNEEADSTYIIIGSPLVNVDF